MSQMKDVEAALAHDLNNTLQVVMGNLEVLRRRGTYAPEIVNAALNATRNAAHLTDRLVAVSRLRNPEPRPLELNAALNDLAEMMTRILGDAIRLELDLSASVGAVLVDPRCLQMALLEVAANARDAMPGGGKLVVRSAAAEGGMAKIEMSDTGPGMAAEKIRHAFEPRLGGEHAKPPVLGLHIVERCMTSCGGRVEISSAPERGTTVSLFLPTT